MNASDVFGYTVALLTGLFGAGLLAGYLEEHLPEQLRITLGIVFLLMSIYRFAVTTIAIKKRVDFE